MPSNSGSLATRVAAAGRRCSLTGSLLVDWGTRGTPRQVEYLAEYLEAECASRDASRRAQLLRRCALPQAKTLDGYDWGSVAWPDSFGRDDLLSLSFLDRQDAHAGGAVRALLPVDAPGEVLHGVLPGHAAQEGA